MNFIKQLVPVKYGGRIAAQNSFEGDSLTSFLNFPPLI